MESYPKNLFELEERFGSDQACGEYLFHLRWPEGHICPRCGHRKAWPMRDNGWFRCAACDYKCSITSGTIFEGTRKSLVL
jgi:hypothetical protein